MCIRDSVGTDHGYVPIYLVKNNLSPAGIARDGNKGPLEKAQEHIREEKLGGKIATRLGNGLAPLEPGETAVSYTHLLRRHLQKSMKERQNRQKSQNVWELRRKK